MYGCESWTIKKPEDQRSDAFELRCWRRLLRDPWTARGSNQSILKEINPEYSLEGLMLKLKLQYFCHLMQRADSLEKTLMVEKSEGKRRMGWQRMRWLDSINDSTVINWSKCWETVKDGEPGMLQSMGALRVRHHLAAEQQIIYYFLSLREMINHFSQDTTHFITCCDPWNILCQGFCFAFSF